MKKKLKNKLIFSKTTVANLGIEEQDRVRGGATEPTSCCSEWPTECYTQCGSCPSECFTCWTDKPRICTIEYTCRPCLP